VEQTRTAHQIKTAAFERTALSDKKLAPAVRVLPQDATGVFKDSYLLDFLDLPERHSEADLQTGLLRNLRMFLMELGDGFAIVGEKVRVQVGTVGERMYGTGDHVAVVDQRRNG
jgi:predicted nuclease of restriction endonuclease-like (RecB) superfamily